MINDKVASAKETYEALMIAKEFHWEKRLSENESKNEKKIVKVLNESFNQNQQSQKEANFEKESMIRIYQGQQTNDQKIISELKRKIFRLEERNISPLRSPGNRLSDMNKDMNIPVDLYEDFVDLQDSVKTKTRFLNEKNLAEKYVKKENDEQKKVRIF